MAITHKKPFAGRSRSLRVRPLLTLLLATLTTSAFGYEPDPDVRKALSKVVKRELISATPGPNRLSVRLSFSTKVAFRDYEKLAKQAGFAPYADCSVASFVDITNWQIIQQRDVTPAQIAVLVKQCESTDVTSLGPKPIPQDKGDREILRGMWQRSLAYVGKTLNDGALQIFVSTDAADKFFDLYGNASDYQLTAGGFKPIANTTPTLTSTATPAETTPTPSAPSTSTSTPAPTQPAASTASNDIERIALRTVTRYGLSGVYVENETYLMYKNGSILRNFSENPYTLNTATFRRQSPKDWGQWRALGSQLQVTWPGKDATTWKKWFTTRAAKPGQTLQGRFQSADGFGGGRVANFNTVAFTKDGRFTWASLKGGNSGGWLPAYSDKRSAGRYELNGYSIRLRYNDGNVEEYAFCFYPKDNEHFVIGANHFKQLE